jgi:hypothetical protein
MMFVEKMTLPQFLDYLCQTFVDGERTRAIVRRGLDRWVAGQSVPIKTPWQCILYLYRFCYTQTNSLSGVMLEDQSANALEKRVPFFDAPEFLQATHYLAETTHFAYDDDQALKDYVYSVLDDSDWFNMDKVPDIHSVYMPGHLSTKWLNKHGELKSFKEFPI